MRSAAPDRKRVESLPQKAGAVVGVPPSGSVLLRVTYAAVFARRKAELEGRGIDSAEKFRKVIHAAQSKRSSDNIKKLHAQQDRSRGVKKHLIDLSTHFVI